MTQNIKVLQAVDHQIYQYFDFNPLEIIWVPRQNISYKIFPSNIKDIYLFRIKIHCKIGLDFCILQKCLSSSCMSLQLIWYNLFGHSVYRKIDGEISKVLDCQIYCQTTTYTICVGAQIINNFLTSIMTDNDDWQPRVWCVD